MNYERMWDERMDYEPISNKNEKDYKALWKELKLHIEKERRKPRQDDILNVYKEILKFMERLAPTEEEPEPIYVCVKPYKNRYRDIFIKKFDRCTINHHVYDGIVIRMQDRSYVTMDEMDFDKHFVIERKR